MFPAALRAIARKTQRLLSQCRANDTEVLQDHCVILLKHRLEGKTFCEVKNLNKLLLILRQRKYTGSGPCCRLPTLLPAPDLAAGSAPCCWFWTLLSHPELGLFFQPQIFQVTRYIFSFLFPVQNGTGSVILYTYSKLSFSS